MGAVFSWISSNQLIEELLFQRFLPRRCRENFFFEFLELFGEKALGAHGGLLSLVVRRHALDMRLRDFDVIAENAIVSDLKEGMPVASRSRVSRSTSQRWPFSVRSMRRSRSAMMPRLKIPPSRKVRGASSRWVSVIFLPEGGEFSEKRYRMQSSAREVATAW